jgi:hypothetical protein
MNKATLDRQKLLVQWVSQATGIHTLGVKVQLQGNDLHILCEAQECPQRWRTLLDLLQALQQTDLQVLTGEQPSIYQVLVYGRKKGEQRPEWCHRVYLNQLDRHLEEIRQALLEDAAKSGQPGAMIVSNESLARQGNLDAIARYLSETLSSLGVAVQVRVKPQPTTAPDQPANNRLWIFCQSAYSPDPSLLGEPIAQKLRHLKLTGYQDAVIIAQVSGETKPDWQLRIDLTPAEVMLKEWARWGDVQAIARLLTEALAEFKVAVQASLQESTLHIFCTPAFDPLATAPAPEKTPCLEVIRSQLAAIAPQGILAATVYGQKTGDKQPAWVDWLALPAKEHPALASLPLELASTGDQPAMIFLLERLLNPDLERRLKIGGIRVLLLLKGDLLHVMCDAPVCPTSKQVAAKVTQFIKQLKIPQVLGVRVYGRRGGHKEPSWHHGEDFEPRQRLVPEAPPEFAATVLYINDLLPSNTDEPILRPDLTTEQVQTFVKEVALDWVTTTRTKAQEFLLKTSLFTEVNQPKELIPDAEGVKVALVWGSLGLLLTLQTDWVLGQIITRTQPQAPPVASVNNSTLLKNPASASQSNQRQIKSFVTDHVQSKFPQGQSSVFNNSGFTQSNPPLRQKATATAILLAARSRMPSFNARQLDEQLALYKQRLAKNGKPPQVLIIGSSRALRGIDPVALSQALKTQGYANIDVFNLGINGATAQVVDFVIRRVLKPSELPKLILWADGSRAFNSGREDVTFKAIAASPGYKQALEQAAATKNPPEATSISGEGKTKIPQKTENSYVAVNQMLNQMLAATSFSYKNREQIKTLLLKQLNNLPFTSDRLLSGSSKTQPATNATEDDTVSLQAVDFDGFLPLSVRFNPEQYYQKHPKVSGNYDGDYQSFQVGGEQDAAFQAVLQFAQSRKITVVFINMPLTAEYLDPVRTKYEQQFQQYMLQFSGVTNFIYRDLSQLWPQANEYFSDPSHLNRFGAYEVSKKLAQDPMISWPTK